MIFKRDKFRLIRKQQRWSLSELARQSKISRMSLSMWENGKLQPSEKKVRELARVLNVSISEISDLSNDAPISPTNLSKIAEDFSSLAMLENTQHQTQINNLVTGISDLDRTIRQASTIINALISSMHSLFYVKDTDQKYIIANEKFLKNLFLGSGYSVLGKTDKDLFNKKEAQQIFEEDQRVLLSGKEILDKEDFIPGSRKKRWGLISKIPIFDQKRNITGIAGVYVDITERKKAEEQRIALNNAINHLDECVWVAKITDLEKNKYKVVYINDAIEKMTGIKKDEFIKNPELWTEFIHPDYKVEIDKLRNSQKFPRHYRYKAIRQDTGEVYWRDDITYKEGDMFFGIARDITTINHTKT